MGKYTTPRELRKWNPSPITLRNVMHLHDSGIDYKELSKRFGVSATTLAKYVKKAKKEGFE